MKLKTLALTVLTLAIVSGLVAWFKRPAPPAGTDPRIGTALVDAATVNEATRIAFTSADGTVELVRTDTVAWQVASYHHLPVDLEKLRRFVGELTGAEFDRVVTRNPELQQRLQLGDLTLTLTTSAGSTWTARFGKTADRGGRYVKLDDAADAPAYLVRLSAIFDTTPKNWVASQLTHFTAADIQTVAFAFPDGAAVTATRESAQAEWSSADVPQGQQLRGHRFSSALTTLNSLRFTDSAAPDAPDVVAAREHERTVSLTTFAGETLRIALGRRPEQTISLPSPEPTENAEAADENETAPNTETIPAGPVYVAIDGPASLAPLTGTDLAFQIAEYSYTSLPAAAGDLFEPATPSTAAPSPVPAPDA